MNLYNGFGAGSAKQSDALTTSEFVSAVENNSVVTCVFNATNAAITGTYMKNGDTNPADAVAFTSTYVGSDSLNTLMQQHPGIKFNISTNDPSAWTNVLTTFLPLIIFAALMIFMFVQMRDFNKNQMGFGKKKTKQALEEHPNTKFSDVAGIDEAVEEVQEIKEFLANPEKFRRLGARIPKGVILIGPPGTGKTLLARAVAGEAGVPFFSISGSDFVEMFVGVGASRVRDLFDQARKASPAIIFIDEIDAVGRQRGAGLGGGHDEREQTLNQLLVEMDGFDENNSVILIAATNRVDILDPALLRPGRFDRQIVVDRPDLKGREQILKVHAKGLPIAHSVDFSAIASLTPGFTGADLANVMNESALLAARRNKQLISMSEVNEAMERQIAGPERKSRIMTASEKKTIAYHESGHALVGHTLEHSDPVHKISIISRGQALGYTLSLPTEDRFLNTREQMYDELATFMGGRVAEELFCDDITTGASNDLERATKMAKQMVTRFGMTDALGSRVYGNDQQETFLGRDFNSTPDYSEETARMIDEEVARIIQKAHDRAKKVLSARREQMDTMATVLLERETVDGPALKALLAGEWDKYLAEEPDILAKQKQDLEQQAAEDEAIRQAEAANQAAQKNKRPAKFTMRDVMNGDVSSQDILAAAQEMQQEANAKAGRKAQGKAKTGSPDSDSANNAEQKGEHRARPRRKKDE
ncbi:MAG: ATP-dependent zinc metalloprotease FtsH [Coriobacteriales bacterium]|nr:ATP-dependent zinc metalloprotease FtsH [Coriobacteriales bacterium]